MKECDEFSRRCFAGSEVCAGFEYSEVSHSLANVINATRAITFVNNFGSVGVFVFVVKEAFDLPCFPQDYEDKIEIRELV